MGKLNFVRLHLRKIANLLTVYNIKRAYRYLRNHGLMECVRRIRSHMGGDGYRSWWREHQTTEGELDRQRLASFDFEPLISIPVPLYNTPIPYLEEMIDSVRNQTYANWELCLADGSTQDQVCQFIREQYAGETKIKYKRLEENLGISGNTNEAVSMAGGVYVGLLDHDDLLAPDALFEIVKVINAHADVDAVYTDEDKISDDITDHFGPAFKPDYNLDLLRSNNYICHFFVVKKEISDRIQGFRSDYDGSQDYDFILRCAENARAVYHVPKILYHWRCHPNSVAANPESKLYAYEAARRAIEDHLRRSGETEALVERLSYWGLYRVTYPVRSRDRISILIPHRDQVKDLRRCIDSVLGKTTYENYHIYIADNNSREQQTFLYYQELEKMDRITVLHWDHESNRSALNNFAAAQSKGRYLVFLNSSTQVIAPDWLELMLSNCQRANVGIVGAKLYFPNDKIAHAGIVIGMGGSAAPVMKGENRRSMGRYCRLQTQSNYSAVSGACMMISRSLFEDLDGFDENLSTVLQDADLCLRAREKNRLIVFDPKIELYYGGTGKTGLTDEEKSSRILSETQYFCSRWNELLTEGDPYYNCNLSLEYYDFRIRQH